MVRSICQLSTVPAKHVMRSLQVHTNPPLYPSTPHVARHSNDQIRGPHPH